MKNKNVEVTLIQLMQKHGKQKPIYKVTRRYPIESIQDTELFDDLNKAKKKFKNWRDCV